VRSSLRTLATVVAFVASTGCSSLGGIELGDDGPDRFPEDDDGYGPSSATADPTRGNEPADDDETSSGSSETSGPHQPDSIGHEATGGGDSSSDGGDTSDGEDPRGTTGVAETSTSGSDTSGDGVGQDGACAGMRLPACPPACDLYEESPCGRRAASRATWRSTRATPAATSTARA
jgi:hypothetical protein